MKKLTIPVLMTAFLFGLFVFGTLTQEVLPMMVAFCGWTPVAWFLGYRVARAGITISVSTSTETTKPAIAEIIPRQKKPRHELSRRVVPEIRE